MSGKKLRRCENLIVNLRQNGTARAWIKGARDNVERNRTPSPGHTNIG